MHSSRMCTACSSSQVPGGNPLGADTPQEQTPHTRHPPGSRPSPDQAPPRSRHPPDQAPPRKQNDKQV